MRRASLSTVLLVAGCNQIYGLEPTRSRDASVDASDRAMHLALMVGGATSEGSQAPITYEAFENPKVRLGTMTGALRDATYIADAGNGGLVDYPFELVNQRWRLEYTPPDGVPHELQWDPPIGDGFVVAPVVGRAARVPAPTGAGYTMSMKVTGNVLYTFGSGTVIYTTGYWSASPWPFTGLTPTVAFATATSLDGPGGSPSEAAGDLVVGVDYGVDPETECTQAKVSGTGRAVALEANLSKPVELLASIQTVLAGLVPELDGEAYAQAAARLTSALGGLSAPATGGRLRFGRIAHTGLPAFTSSLGDVPAPPMLPIFDCALPRTTDVNVNELAGLGFEKAFHVSVTSDRMAAGALLRSSIAFVGLFTNGMYRGTLQVPLATAVQLGTKTLDTDAVQIGADANELTFALDRTAPYVAHYVEATLYRIENAKLVPVRVYVTADLAAARPSVRIDPALVLPGVPHVFAIRTYRGRPRAPNGDFRVVEGFQTVGTVFTSTFTR